MGCLNSNVGFAHWFGNIHLSGPCNRSCYFCIGQHMLALDSLNTLAAWPLPGLEEFVARCRSRDVRAIYLTGTNTDPLLYRHHRRLSEYLRRALPGVKLGLRTNGVKRSRAWRYYDTGSLTVCSFDPANYRLMMGSGTPPDVAAILAACSHFSPPLKVNIVLGPENTGERKADLMRTLARLGELGVRRVNLREPYGQPHVGDPFAGRERPLETRFGMPCYRLFGMTVTYWDVHWVEVESVNLYASGRVSETYPITKGHAPDGVVMPQSAFPGGRVHAQWVSSRRRSPAVS